MRVVTFFGLMLVLVLSACAPRKVERISTWGEPPRDTYWNRNQMVVVIDAGHGGKDAGTYSSESLKEKDLTLATAKMLKNALHHLGYHTIMTRSSDVFIPLKERSRFANGHKGTLFVSVHYNAAPNTNAHGIEVFYYEKDDKRSEASKRLAGDVLEELLAATGAKSRGVKHGNFSVIRETEMPAILVEGGFLSNEKERKLLCKPSYLRKIAKAIAEGVHQYLH